MRFPVLLLIALVAGVSPATTLEQLSLEDLAKQSTAVVQGKVTGERTVQAGPLLYTLKTVAISKRWKGASAATIEVATPGGRVGDQQQRFGGAPLIEQGVEYVLFLWQGPSGRVQITGFSQGVCEVRTGSGGSLRVVRRPSSDVLITPDGTAAAGGDGLDLPYEAFSQLVGAAVGGAPRP